LLHRGVRVRVYLDKEQFERFWSRYWKCEEGEIEKKEERAPPKKLSISEVLSNKELFDGRTVSKAHG